MKRIDELYTKNEQDLYVNDAFLWYVIFNKDKEIYKKSEIALTISFLEQYKTAIEDLVKVGAVNKKLKNNIYDFLWNLREIKDDKREERISIISEIIRSVNCQESDNSIDFYKAQLCVRKATDKYNNCYLNDSAIEYINDSICIDYVILSTHLSKYTSDEDFEKTNYLTLSNNIFAYFDSLNMILYECPSIFLDETFRKRINIVLSKNSSVNLKKFNKQLTKTIKKVEKGIE